jgi:hypothetical protein
MPRRADNTQFHLVITMDNDKLRYGSRSAARLRNHFVRDSGYSR